MMPFFLSVGGRSSLIAARARSPERAGNHESVRMIRIGLVPVVTGEELVGPVPREDDFDVSSRNFGDEIRWEKRGIGKRLVKVNDQLVEENPSP